MANFKNRLSVSGSKSLLKAFSEELLNLGYTMNYTIKDPSYCIVNYENETSSFAFHSHPSSPDRIKLSLPSDWNEAIRLASEKEEEKFKVGEFYTYNNNARENLGSTKTNEGRCFRLKSFKDHLNTRNKRVLICEGGYEICETWCRLATPQEIEAYLLKEKEKEGWVKGAKVIRDKKEFKDAFYNIVEKKFFDSSGLTDTRIIEELRILNSKVFAKVSKTTDYILVDIEALKLLPSCPQIKVGSYEVEFFESHIKVGCTKVDLNQIKAIHDHYYKP